MSNKWSVNDIPDLTGKVIIITGANSGLGLEATKILSSKGAKVVMACRNLEKAEKAKKEILDSNPEANLDVMELDNANLDSVRIFAENFKEKYEKLDILFNNAGVMAIPRSETKDGFEMQFGVNHLGHFALTGRLLNILSKTKDSRVHCTSSSAAFNASINFDDLMGKTKYSRWGAYMQSKLANAVFAKELDIRFKSNALSCSANSSHPGLVMTNLQENSLNTSGKPFLERALYVLFAPLMAQDLTMGVLPMLYATTSSDAIGGEFYGPKFLRVKGYPVKQEVNKLVYDKAVRERLWQVSQELTGVSYL